jgi:hypothetical protein
MMEPNNISCSEDNHNTSVPAFGGASGGGGVASFTESDFERIL